MTANTPKVEELTYRNSTIPEFPRRRLQTSSALWLQKAVTIMATAITSQSGVPVEALRASTTNLISKTQESLKPLRMLTLAKTGDGMAAVGDSLGLGANVKTETDIYEKQCGSYPPGMSCRRTPFVGVTGSSTLQIKVGKQKKTAFMRVRVI